jgi:hypothetical protein
VSNVRSHIFIPAREQTFTLFRESNLAAEGPINSGEFATNISAANHEKVRRRMNPVQKFVAVDHSQILGSNTIWTRSGGQDDVLRLDFIVLLLLIGNPNAMFIDEGSPAEGGPTLPTIRKIP